MTETAITYQLERIDCGRCPKWHGPYWYAYWKRDGKLRKLYIGRKFRSLVAKDLDDRDQT